MQNSTHLLLKMYPSGSEIFNKNMKTGRFYPSLPYTLITKLKLVVNEYTHAIVGPVYVCIPSIVGPCTLHPI